MSLSKMGVILDCSIIRGRSQPKLGMARGELDGKSTYYLRFMKLLIGWDVELTIYVWIIVNS